MSAAKSIRLMPLLLLLCLSFSACNIPTAEIPGVTSILWEDDSEGFLQFYTNDSHYCEHLFVVWKQPAVDPMQSIDIDVKKISGHAWGGYGIIFCVQDASNYYLLGITTTGYYSIGKLYNGTWYEIEGWLYTHLLNKGFGAVNKVHISYENSTYTFTVKFNDDFVTSFVDTSFSGGSHGSYVEVLQEEYEHFPYCPVDVRFKSAAKIAVDPLSGLLTTEAGGMDEINIVLKTEPTADVVIPISSSNTTEGQVSPPSVTFTPSDWSIPQTVTVTGIDDGDADGDQSYLVVLGQALSSDPNYDGVDATDVAALNKDNEVSKLLSPYPRGRAYLGVWVAIDGDYAIIGASGDTGGGAAYIFHRTDTNIWDSGTKIVAPDAQNNDSFGVSVAIDGDYAIVGASAEDDGGSNAGAAYIFHRIGTNTWDLGTKIRPTDSASDDRFGGSVGIQGDYAVVGAADKDEGGYSVGAAYIFHRIDVNTWDSGIKLQSENAQNYGYFGSSVDIHGDHVIVGAREEDQGGGNAGTVYVFRRTAADTWDSITQLLAPDAQGGDYFGCSVSIDGDYAIVGANYEDEGGSEAGAAYIFHRSGPDTWDAGTKIIAPDAESSDNFGHSVGISGDYAIVGARNENQGGSRAGAAYIFQQTAVDVWDTGIKVLAPDAEQDDRFGTSVGLSGIYYLVGALYEDEAGDNAGAGYVFYIP